MQSATRPAETKAMGLAGATARRRVPRRTGDLSETAVRLVQRIDHHLDAGEPGAVGPLLDQLRACDPLVLSRPTQDEVLRCWARGVADRIGSSDVPAATVAEDLTMVETLRAAVGRGPGPTPLLRLRWARLRGEAQDAAAAANLLRMHGSQDWNPPPEEGIASTRPQPVAHTIPNLSAEPAEPADEAPGQTAVHRDFEDRRSRSSATRQGTHSPGERCRSCELSEYGAWLTERRHYAAAARTLLAAADGADSCPEEPGRALARALLPLLHSGRPDDARAAYVAGCANREAPGDVLGMRLLFLARGNNGGLGIQLLRQHRRVLLEEPIQDRRLAALTGASALLDTVRAQGHGTCEVYSPEGEAVSVTELARDVRLRAQRLANLFDRRHGSDHCTRLLEEALTDGQRGSRRSGRHRRGGLLSAAAFASFNRTDQASPAPPTPAVPSAQTSHAESAGSAVRRRFAAAMPTDRLALGLAEPVLPAATPPSPTETTRRPTVRSVSEGQLTEALGRAERLLDAGHPGAADAWAYAAECVRRGSALVGPAEVARVDAGHGELAARAGDLDGAAESLRRALQVRRACLGTDSAAGVAGRLGEVLVRAGRAEEGNALLDDAVRRLSTQLDQAQTHGRLRQEPVELIRALHRRALLRAGAGETLVPHPRVLDPAHLTPVRDDLQQASALAFAHKLHAEEALLYSARANLLHARQPGQAERLLRDAERLWIRMGQTWYLAGAAHWIGLCAEALGRHQDAAEAQERAQQLAARWPEPELLRRALYAQLRAVRASGPAQDAVTVGLPATVVLEEAGERQQAAFARRILGSALLELGRDREAAGYLAAAHPDIDEDEPAERARCRGQLAAALLRIGDRQGAVTHHGFASQEWERAGELEEAAAQAVRTGEVLTELGRSTLAVRAYLHAADVYHRAPTPGPLAAARVRCRAADLLVAAGERAAAAVTLTRAWYDSREAEVTGEVDGDVLAALRRRIDQALAAVQAHETSG